MFKRFIELIDGFIANKSQSEASEGPSSFSNLAKAVNDLTGSTVFTKAMMQKYVAHRRAGNMNTLERLFNNSLKKAVTCEMTPMGMIHPVPQLSCPVFFMTLPVTNFNNAAATSYVSGPPPGFEHVTPLPPPFVPASIQQDQHCARQPSPMPTPFVPKPIPRDYQGARQPSPIPPSPVQKPLQQGQQCGRQPVDIYGDAVPYEIGYTVDLDKTLVYSIHGSTVKTYHKNSAYKDTVYYECYHCESRAKMKDNVLYARPHQPNCNSEPLREFNLEQCLRFAKVIIRNGCSMKYAHEAAFQRAMKLDCYNGLFPMFSEMAHSYQRVERNRYREAPTNLKNDDIRWALPSSNDLHVYSSDLMLKTLANCKIAVADGTFKSSPAGFYQMVTIIGLVESKTGAEYVPLVMALLPDKTSESYLKLVHIIKAKMTELNLEIKIERLHTDYETALQDACKELVGHDRVYGCSFHYNQLALRKFIRVGLYDEYMDTDGPFVLIRRWLRLLLALPTLPRDDMLWLWNEALQFPPENPGTSAKWPKTKLQAVVQYMKSWIAIKDNTWTFFGLGRVRNTNACEGYHGNLPLKSKNPSLNRFLDTYCTSFTHIHNRLIRLEKGAKVRRRCPLYEALENQRTALEKDYEQDRRNFDWSDKEDVLRKMIKFIRRQSHLLHEIRNKSANTVKSGRTKSVKSRKNAPKSTRKPRERIMAEVENELIQDGEVTDDVVKYVVTPKEAPMFDQRDVATDRCIENDWKFLDDADNCVELCVSDGEFRYQLEDENDDDENEYIDDDGNDDELVVMVQPKRVWAFRAPTPVQLTATCDFLHVFQSCNMLVQQLIDLLKAQPAIVHDVAGDGHCGYRALSYLVSGTEDNHLIVRKRICDYILDKQLPDLYYTKPENENVLNEALLKKDPPNSIIGHPEYWIDSPDLFAFACMTGFNVVSWNDDSRQTLPKWVLFNRTTVDMSTYSFIDAPTILLFYANRHYKAILSVKPL